MSKIVNKLVVILFIAVSWSEQDQKWSSQSNQGEFNNQISTNEECVKRIYRDCNHPTTFTDEELENVRQFLNYSFTVLADIKPEKPLCPKLYVRRDWKCLTQIQRKRVIYTWKRMYENGDIQKLTDLHVRYWPAWHKGGEFLLAHRWMEIQFEKDMRSYDSSVTLPYWDFPLYGNQPERSSVWDVLGHSGNYSTGYCVTDGIYNDWNLIPCIKRHWSYRDTIYPWISSEEITRMLQTSNSFSQMTAMRTSMHFQTHINVGGYEGQYAITSAPYDALFFMHHVFQNQHLLFKWQFQRSEFLTPLSYNDNNWRFNMRSSVVEKANISKDLINGLPEVTVREMFWFGFGDLCFIPDQMVRPINSLWKGITDRDVIPTAVKRLRALPQWILRKYFPEFLSNNYSFLYYQMEEVGQCNTQCLPLPKPTFLSETETGRRQLMAFAYDNGVDTLESFLYGEEQWYEMWKDLNKVGYCSPYVTYY